MRDMNPLKLNHHPTTTHCSIKHLHLLRSYRMSPIPNNSSQIVAVDSGLPTNANFAFMQRRRPLQQNWKVLMKDFEILLTPRSPIMNSPIMNDPTVPPSSSASICQVPHSAQAVVPDSSSEYIFSDQGVSTTSRSSSPEKHVPAISRVKKRKRKVLVDNKKRFIIGSTQSRLSRTPLPILNRANHSSEIEENVEQKGVRNKMELFEQCDESDDELNLKAVTPKDEHNAENDTEVTARTNINIQDAEDLAILKNASIVAFGKLWDEVMVTYLVSGSSRADGRPEKDNKTVDKLEMAGNRPRATGINSRKQHHDGKLRSSDSHVQRGSIRNHFRTLLYPDFNNSQSNKIVPWKNIGIWLFLQEKRFIRWDSTISTHFPTILSFFFRKDVLHKVLSIDLEDWTEDEKTRKFNSEIPLVLDPQNQVLCKVEHLCEMYRDRFVKARGNLLNIKSEIDSEYAGPWIITFVGTRNYITPGPSQSKGKGRLCSPDSDSGFFD